MKTPIENDLVNVAATIRAALITAIIAEAQIPGYIIERFERDNGGNARRTLHKALEQLGEIASLTEQGKTEEAGPLAGYVSNTATALLKACEDEPDDSPGLILFDAYVTSLPYNAAFAFGQNVSERTRTTAAKDAIMAAEALGYPIMEPMCKLFDMSPYDWPVFITLVADGMSPLEASIVTKMIATGRD